MLQLKNILKSYTTGDFTQKALDEVSLSFRKSEYVTVLGPSGSGKTTFLNVIGGLDHYDSGDLIIDGKTTKEFADSDWDAYRNNSIGFIFQSYNLISHLNVIDNVEIGMTLSNVSDTKKHKKAIEVLERVGLKNHIHKKPNQLSGGEMQRVAIARALANDPDIILADEPTGALDTHTSNQILDLIKEIAEDKLVIMVTHNPDITNKYADRVIEFLDGKVISDSNPYEVIKKDSTYKLKKISMGFPTALKISGTNIATKKWRTALTAFASSIGIIGIALILSLSNGFDKQISNFENSTLSGFPIMITQTTSEFNISTMRERRSEMLKVSQKANKYPDVNYIYPYDSSEDSVRHTNIITEEYIGYLEDIDSSLLSGISYTRRIRMNMLKSDGEISTLVNSSLINFTAYPTIIDLDKTDYLETNYDLLAGKLPSGMTDLILVVDSYNKIDISILHALGINYEADNIDFDTIISKEYKVVLNDDYYIRANNIFTINGNPNNLMELYNNKNNITLSITGIIRAKEEIAIEVLSPGIVYSDDLSQFLINNASTSEIVKLQKDVDYNVLTGLAFEDFSISDIQNTGNSMPGIPSGGGSGRNGLVTKDVMLSRLGADGIPSLITLYPVDFDAKEKVLEYINIWNDDKEIDDTIIYTDLASTFASLSSGIMNAVTLVLIAFAAISLIVSLIMIGIITYVSVLERTKEIGILRALGARKKDITRVFNAETFIIGSFSGLLGIGIAYFLTLPINIILKRLTDLSNIAQLNPLHAILLIAISVLLTMLGGAIPAKMAAKKDPVAALRAE